MKEYMREFFKGFIDLFKCIRIRAEDIGACVAMALIMTVFVSILFGIQALVAII